MQRPTINQILAERLEEMNNAIAMQDPLRYFTAEEVANYFLNTGSRKLVDYAREFGLIKATRIGQSFLYNRKAIEDFLKVADGCEMRNRDDMRKIAEKIIGPCDCAT